MEKVREMSELGEVRQTDRWGWIEIETDRPKEK